MVLLEKIKKVSASNKDLLTIRLKSSKMIFLISALLFFINYFFLIANFYSEIFEKTFIYTYTLFVVSFFIVLYFLAKKMFFWKNKIVFFILLLIIILALIGTLLPFTIKLWA